jgi:hypothetical protein
MELGEPKHSTISIEAWQNVWYPIFIAIDDLVNNKIQESIDEIVNMNNTINIEINAIR